jgi:hypothetical protein
MAFAGVELIGDKNDFLKNFINHELLNTLGFMMAILISTCVIINENLNKIDEKFKVDAFKDTRKALTRHVFGSVVCFLVCFSLVLMKPGLPEYWRAVVNSLGVSSVIYFSYSLLDVALTSLAFRAVK